MGWLQNPGIINGLADGLTGGINAYGTAQKAKADAQQRQLEMALKQRLADLQGEELKAKAQEAQFKNYGTGLENVGGVVQPRADFIRPGMNYQESQAFYERAKKQQPLKLGDAFKARQAFRSGVINPGDENIELSDGLSVLAKEAPLSPSQIQVDAYEKQFGKGTSQGLTPAQLMNGIAVSGNQSRLGQQFKESLNQNEKIAKDRMGLTKEGLNLQRAKAIEDPEKSMAGLANSMSRMDDIIAQAQQINPSGIEYYTLKNKAIASSFDPVGIVPKLTPEENQRLAFYSGLTQDSIAKMFESGGKALTDTERRLAEETAISPRDNTQQIIAKAQRLNGILKSRFDIEAAPAERILPGVSSQYRPKIEKSQSGIKNKIKSHAPEKRVSVVDRNGVSGDIPESQIQQALKEGYSLVK